MKTMQDSVEVKENPSTGQKALHSLTKFKPGDAISSFSAGEEFKSPNYLTIQKADNLHISLLPGFLQYVNHSCSPNAFFDTIAMNFICIAPIEVGDEITFFYPSSEWDMAQPFNCHCGSPHCLGIIKGAAQLPDEVLKNYRLTDFIRMKLEERKQSAA